MRHGYQRDLAYIHDVGFGGFARRAAPGILAMLQRAGIRDGVVVDLGCGSGIWVRHLIRAGYEPVGIDASRAMIRNARTVAPQATLRVASIHECRLPSCRAVTAMGEVISYLTPGEPTPSLSRLFRRVAQALDRGGVFVFDALVEGSERPMRYAQCREGPDWAVMVDVIEQPGKRRLIRDITTFRKVGRTYTRSTERHTLRVSSRASIESSLRNAGFSARVLRKYGEFMLPRRRLVFRARKQ